MTQLFFTYLIVPAWSDQGGQMRIVRTDRYLKDALQDYRDNPERWKEVGLIQTRAMNQQTLTYFEGPAPVARWIKDDLPLMGGTTYRYSEAA
jgi:hypothetical protein